MTKLLYALGQFVVRFRWLVIAFWIVLIAGTSYVAINKGADTNNAVSLPGTDSQTANDLVGSKFTVNPSQSSPVVIHTDTATLTTPQNAATINATVASLSQAPHIKSAVNPLSAQSGTLSQDQRTAYITVTFDIPSSDITEEFAEQISDAAKPARDAGLQVEFGSTLGEKLSKTESKSDALGVLLALVILLVMFRTVAGMTLPILTALGAVAVGVSIVDLLTHVVKVPSAAPTLAIMLGLGVGIDYSLFLLSSYRGRLRRSANVTESLAQSVATTGGSVVFAGLTVMLALATLAIAGINLTTTLGYMSAIAVGVSMLAALTLLPALLAAAGWRILPKALRGQKAAGEDYASPRWKRWTSGVIKRPVTSIIVALLILIPLAMPTLNLKLGAQDDGAMPTSTTVRKAYDLLSSAFGAGTNGPILAVVQLSSPAQAASRQAAQQTPAGVDQRASDPRLQTIRSNLQQTSGTASIGPPVINQDGTVAYYKVVATTGPTDQATADYIQRLRRDVLPPAEQSTTSQIAIGGQTAVYVDLADLISRKLPYIVLAAIALSFIMLLLAFRSILVPVQAALKNLLAVGAAYGILVMVFQQGFGIDLIGLSKAIPIVSYVPLMLFVILFGLSIDYEFFLMSHVKEHYAKHRNVRQAIVDGVVSSNRVITAAALIMVTVFASFILNPDPTIKEFGLGLAVAIALVASVLRSLMAPALLSLFGKLTWWFPKWLSWVPTVDVEGETVPNRKSRRT